MMTAPRKWKNTLVHKWHLLIQQWNLLSMLSPAELQFRFWIDVGSSSQEVSSSQESLSLIAGLCSINGFCSIFSDIYTLLRVAE
jgi:hypothetical protein